MKASFVKRVQSMAKHPFVRGVAYFQIGSVMMMFIGLASSVLYARILGVGQFGLYALITAFVGLISIANSYGQETATATYLAEAIGRKDHISANRVLRYYGQATLLSTAIYIVLFIAAPRLSIMLEGNEMIGQFGRLVILNTMLQPISVLLYTSLQLERRIGTVVTLESGSDLLQFLICSALLLMGWGISGIFVGTLVTSVLSVPLYLWLYERSATRRGLPTLWRIVRNVFTWDTREYAVQGLWIALDQSIGKNLYPNLFYVVLGKVAPLEVVGVFRLAMRLAALPFSLIMPSVTRMTTIALPRMAGQNPGALLRSSKQVLFGTLGLGICACIGAAIFAPPLIPIVYGKAFAAATPIFLLLLVPNLLSSTHVLSIPLLRIFKRVWMISIVNGIGVVIGLGVFWTLLKTMSAIWSIGIGIAVFQLNSLLLFVYLAFLLRGKMHSPSPSTTAEPA